MIGEANSLQKDHWFCVGERTAMRIFETKKATTAEQEANKKNLFGNVRSQFISGFRLKMVDLQKEKPLV